jgi:hypothetical protein
MKSVKQYSLGGCSVGITESIIGMYIMPPESISMVYFTHHSHQALALYQEYYLNSLRGYSIMRVIYDVRHWDDLSALDFSGFLATALVCLVLLLSRLATEVFL